METGATDDLMYMTSEFSVRLGVHHGSLEFKHVRQSGMTDTVILYQEDLRELHKVLSEFLNHT